MPTKIQAEKAARWWTTQLRNPTYRATAPGERDEGGAALASMLATVRAAGQTLPEEKLQVFTKVLERLIVERGLREICTDYGPEPILADAMIEAGLERYTHHFPWKTMLWFEENDVVKASLGYQGRTVEVT